MNSFHESRFPYTQKAVPYPAKSKAGDVLHYIKSAIGYINYLVTEMEADKPIAGRRSYWVNKLASRLWNCNSWDIVEKEKWNTIWTFWHPKQRDF